MIKTITLTAILLLSSCNVSTDPNSRIMRAVNEIKPKEIDTHLCHVSFYCGDSVHTFRNVKTTDISDVSIECSDGSSMYGEGYKAVKRLYSITHNGRLYKSDKIHIFYD